MNDAANWGPKAEAYFKAAARTQQRGALKAARTREDYKAILPSLRKDANHLFQQRGQDQVTLSAEAQRLQGR